MNAQRKSVGIAELGVGSRRFTQALRSGVLPVFVATCAAEGLLLLLLPGTTAAVVEPLFSDPAWGILSSPVGTGFLGLAVLLLSLVELVRSALFAPLRRVALDDLQLNAKEAFSDSVRRMIPVFFVKQLTGLMVLGATLLFMLFGVQMATIPYAAVTFVFAPAIYLVAAHDRNLVTALRDSLRIARQNIFAVFGVQGALLVLAVWLGQLIQQLAATTLTAPMATAWGLISAVLVYRFASFYAMSTLFLALDENGHCDATS